MRSKIPHHHKYRLIVMSWHGGLLCRQHTSIHAISLLAVSTRGYSVKRWWQFWRASTTVTCLPYDTSADSEFYILD